MYIKNSLKSKHIYREVPQKTDSYKNTRLQPESSHHYQSWVYSGQRGQAVHGINTAQSITVSTRICLLSLNLISTRNLKSNRITLRIEFLLKQKNHHNVISTQTTPKYRDIPNVGSHAKLRFSLFHTHPTSSVTATNQLQKSGMDGETNTAMVENVRKSSCFQNPFFSSLPQNGSAHYIRNTLFL